MTNFIKKGFTISVVVATIMWAVGLAAFMPVGALAASYSEGDLIKMAGLSSVYYYAGGERYVFPNESTYFSWYSDFSSVKTISQSELEAIPLGSNVVMRPGTKLVKITTDPKVYAVEPDGVLRHIDSEARATTLFGANWAQRVVDVPDAFFTNYDIGDALDSDIHPEGSLVKYAGAANIYYINSDGDKRKVANMDAFNANRFQLGNVLTISDSLTYDDGTDIAAGESGLYDTSQGFLGTVLTGDLTVALASDSPASAGIPAGTTGEFLKFNMTAGDEAVEITSITLTAGGLGTVTNIDDATMYAAGSKVGTSKDVNSDGYATFNFSTPIEVEAGTTKEFSVKAKIASGQTGKYSLGIAAADDVLCDANVGGSFPVQGHQMEATTGVTVGTITLDAADNDTSSEVGADDVSLVEFTAAASSVEDINFKGLTLKNNGTIGSTEMGTMSLLHDGVEVSTAKMSADKYVTFSFDDVLIKKGQSESFEIKGDFDGGSSTDTMQLYVKDATDVNAVGTLYGYQATVVKTAFDTDDGDSTLITLSAGEMSINWDKTEYPSADIRQNTDNIAMGELTITANDEATKITALSFTINGITTGNTEVENPELYDTTTGGIIDLTYADATGIASTDDEIYIAAGGSKTFLFRLDTTTTADASDVYTVTLASSGITAEGDISGTTISSITPSSITSSNMTIVAAGLTHQTKTLAAVSTIVGASDVAVYKATLKASTSSDIRITKVQFNDNNVANTYFTDSDVVNAKLVINDSVVKNLAGQIAEDTGAGDNILSFTGLSYTVPAGQTYTMYLKLSFADSKTGSAAFTLDVSDIDAKDDESNDVTVTPDSTVGPSVAINAAGALDVYGSITEADANRDVYVAGGTTSEFLAGLKFDANYEDVKVKDLKLYTVNDTNVGDSIQRVELVDADKATVLATSTDFTYATIDGTGTLNDLRVLFDDWNYTIDDAQVKTVYVRAVTKEIGSGAEQTGSQGENIKFYIEDFTAEGVQSGTSIDGTGAASVTSDATSEFDNDFVTKIATNTGVEVTDITSQLANGVLTNGETTIGKFKITVENGNNTDTSGNAAALYLEDVETTLSFSGVTWDAVSLVYVQAYLESDPSTTVSVTTDPDTDASPDINLSSLGYITDSDTLVFVATALTGAGNAGDYVQVKFGSISGADFEWHVNSGGSTIDGVRLPYTSVAGGVLSN